MTMLMWPQPRTNWHYFIVNRANMPMLYLFQKSSLEVLEAASGPGHPDATTSLNRPILFVDQDEYAEVEPLYKRALTIRENTLGIDHPDVAVVLENMAVFYIDIGKKEEAERLTERAKKIHLK